MSSRVRHAWSHSPVQGLLVVIGAMTLLACGPEADAITSPLNVAVGLAIVPPALSLIVGGEERLTGRAYNAKDGATNATFTWSSADTAIATVGRTDGIVTAISAGSTIVTAAAGALRATARVSVVAIAGSFVFARGTWSSPGSFSSDVLWYSSSDRSVRSLSRPAQFASIAAPAWSADGTLMALEVIHGFVDSPERHTSDYSSDVYVLDAAASSSSPWRALTANGLSKSPSWSPDGKRIAYVQQQALFGDSHIYVIDAAGGEPVRLTETEEQYSGPRWSPDGNRLAFAGGFVGDVYIINADGSGLTNVTQSVAHDSDPSWSPDGERLAFVSNRDAPGSYVSEVFVVDVNGSNVKRLTSLGGSSWGPAWSPDGRLIVFSLDRAIHVMNADGSSLIQLTTPPLNSSDGRVAWRR